MSLNSIILPLLLFDVVLLIAVLCYAPVIKHIRYNLRSTIITMSIVCALLSITISSAAMLLSKDFGIVNLICVVFLFFAYHSSLTLHISQSGAVFMLICSFATFLTNFSIIFDAHLHPHGELADYSSSAFVFLLVLFIIFCCIFIYPLGKYGSYILDHLHLPRVWWLTVLVSTTFYAFNLRMIVHHYSTLHTNKVGVAYITVMITMFVLLIMLCIIFYLMVNALIQKAETDDRNRILEMQEKQFESLQQYLEADAKVRHDFRQTLYTLSGLSLEKNYQELDEYLSRYRSELPQRDTYDYCKDHSLNALLNHYMQKAEKSGIHTDIEIALPGILYIDSIDLCSIIGNILENAITACMDIPKEKRFVHVIMSAEQNGELYISISNSFDGKAIKKKGRYQTTHKGGNGIGLISVAATASNYGGSAEFTHDDTVFYSDIILINKKSEPDHTPIL